MRRNREMLNVVAVIGLCAVAVTVVQAAPSGRLVSRPLTPREIKDARLPASTQKSAGLLTTGVGMPVYLEVMATGITATQVTWRVQAPGSSAITALTPSPLTNLTVLPIYDYGERSTYALPTTKDGSYLQARKVLKPDAVGQYVVVATVRGTETTSNTLYALSLTNTVTAARYIGVDSACFYCHGGYGVASNDNVTGWMMTEHSVTFEDAINGEDGTRFNKACFSCHTTGYDTNALAKNDGFDDVMTSMGWVPPVPNPAAWAAMPIEVQDKANVQCEDCHGPASQHNGNTNKIDISVSAGVCASCHDSTNDYVIGVEWQQSGHGSGSASYRANSDYSSAAPNKWIWCARCHSTPDFIDTFDGDGKKTRSAYPFYQGITCAACHDPHADPAGGNIHLLRTLADVNLGYTNNPTGGIVTQGGEGKLCMNCHRSRFTDAILDTAGKLPDNFGPHDNPAADMLAATNGVEYGGFPNLFWRTPHLDMLTDSCVDCHMRQNVKDSANPVIRDSWKYAQGHTMKMTTTGGVAVVSGCGCHTGIEEFDFVSKFNITIRGQNHDYDGDGVTNGTQTEVQGLLDKLARLLPPVGTNTVTSPSSAASTRSAAVTNHTPSQLKAIYNWQLVNYDGSKGVHNAGYAVSLLQASIADLESQTNLFRTLDLWVSPTNGGTLSTAGLINLGGGHYTGTFISNQTWDVTATAVGGFTFTNWSNGKTKKLNVFTVVSNATYTAYFTTNTPSFALNFLANPTIGGVVTVVDGGIGSNPDYPIGAVVKAYATVNANWAFTGWSDGTATTNLSITVKSNATYTANFVPFNIRTLANPPAGGTVSGSGFYTPGQAVPISAVPAANYVFLKWSDNLAATHWVTAAATGKTFTATFDGPYSPMGVSTALRPRFSWPATRLATKYVLTIKRNGVLFKTITVTGVTTWPANVDFTKASYTWTVASKNAAGTTIKTSKVISFTKP